MDMLQNSTGTPGEQVHRTCRARNLINAASLDAETRAGVWAYIDADPRDPEAKAASTLSKYLVSQGIPLSIDAIRRHRRRECACPDRKDTDD